MAEVVLYHHSQGLTDGVKAFAEELRQAGHTVHTPDLYDGKTFTDLNEGVAHADRTGFDAITDRGVSAADRLPADMVYAGFSLGAMPAQKLAQNRAGARAAVFLHSSADPAYFGSWPDGLRAQIHTMQDDDWGDVDVGQELAATIDTIELFLYPGDGHLFTDSSLAVYDEDAAKLVMQRVLTFIDDVG